MAPWNNTDYDARVPGADAFAQAYYAYGELLHNESRFTDRPVITDGTLAGLYAGLADALVMPTEGLLL